MNEKVRLSSADLKAQAKETLLGNYRPMIGGLVLVELISLVLSELLPRFFDMGSQMGIIIYYVVTVILTLILGVFDMGVIYMNFKLILGKKPKISDVFYGFKSHADKAIILRFILYLIAGVCMLPALLIFLAYNMNGNPMLLMVMSMLLVIGMAIAVVFLLQYSLVYYLALDFPQYGVKKIMSLSKEIMRGNMARIFYLHISFIPLLLLGVLTVGIGYLFIIPYRNMTFAYVYMNMIRERENNNISGQNVDMMA